MTPEDFSTPRPWVQLAAFCQAALTENTGQLSVIRIVDRWMIVGTQENMPPTNVQLTMAVVLKSDQMNGQYKLKIRFTSPTGKVTDGPEIPVLFEGNDRGVQMVMPSGILATEPGLYWFDVLIEDDVLTRVPLRLMYQYVKLPPGAGLVGPAPDPQGPQAG